MGIRRELRVEMPRGLFEVFAEQPRIVLEPAPGLWPVDLKALSMLEKLLHDDAFNERFEVMIIPR